MKTKRLTSGLYLKYQFVDSFVKILSYNKLFGRTWY